MNLTLKEIYKIFNKRVNCEKDRLINGISIDTRTLKKGDVFFAIKGENTDGHNFIKDAFEKGAILCVAQKNYNEKTVVVKDTKTALLKLASYYLNKFKNIRVFAITGSNGKTTTKEILYKILSKKFKEEYILKNPKSFNNIIGIPLTIFGLNNKHKILILEVGMNRLGEIKQIMSMIKIDVAVITNIGLAHIGLLKSKKNIARAKSEIFYGLKNGGVAVLNRDDEYYNFLLKQAKEIVTKPKIISFGMRDDADLKISDINSNNKYIIFNLKIKNQSVNIKTRLLGRHNVFNIAAATLVSYYSGVKLQGVKKVVENFKIKNMMRMEKKYIGGITIIKDCYNANPDSFKTALQFLKENKFKNIVAVAGDMYELGKFAKKFHNDIGGLFSSIELKRLILTGKYSDYYTNGFFKAGGNKKIVKIFDKKQKISRYLQTVLEKGDTLFIKGSRKNKLEEILDDLKFISKRR